MLRWLILPTLLVTAPLLCQSLTPERLVQLETACPQDAPFRAMKNALAQADGQKVARDWAKATSVDSHFTKRIPDEPVADQKASGRCWMFSGLNLFRRTAATKLGCESLELSQNYLFFYDKLEKANLYLEAIDQCRDQPYTDRRVEFLLTTPIQEGGNWMGFVELVKKYGVVPKEVMPETFSSSSSSAMNQVLAMRLQSAGLRIRAAKDLAEIVALKTQALKDVYRILALHLGTPPSRFSWRFEDKSKQLSPWKTWTPQAFFREAIGDDLDSYVAIYSIPTLPFNRKFEIDLDRALVDGPNMTFVNCPLAVLKEAAQHCILADHLVWFGADVSQEVSSEDGLMMPGLRDYTSIYGMDLSLDRKGLFETHRSTPNHNMVFTGVDIRDGKPEKWLVENSWGEKPGKKGYFTMLDGWFDLYVDVVVVPRSFVPQEVLAVFNSKAETLPPWNPMSRGLRFE
jgi:bleomycin hydrolase